MAPNQAAQRQMKSRDAAGTVSNALASSQVYEALRARIIALELLPGARLSRPELADQFGVSASPVREALQRLERDGFVTTFPQSRTIVSHIDPVMVQQEHFLRTGIECEVVHALAKQRGGVILNKAAAIVRMQRVLVAEPDQMELFRKLDEDFHSELFAAAGQRPLFHLATERSSQMARLRSMDLPSEGKLASVVEGHQAILAAIETGNCHAASDAMRAHLSGTIARLSAIQEQYPEYFDQDTAQPGTRA